MRRLRAFILAVCGLAVPALALEVAVPNASFEVPEAFDGFPAEVTGDGDASTVPGWTFGVGAGAPAGGVSDPTDDQYVGASGNDAVLLAPADGGQTLFLSTTLAGDEGTFTTNESVGVLAPETHYTLTVAVGHPLDGVHGDVSIAVLGDGVEVARTTVSGAQLADGSFTDLPLRFSTDASEPSRAISIELRHTGSEDATQIVDFDNVRLVSGSLAAVVDSVDTSLFNNVGNDVVAGDQIPGLVDGASVTSSAVKGGWFATDLFGAVDGGVEPGLAIFEDGGVADNGNDVFGDGGETVDFVEWTTVAPVRIAGYRIGLGPDSFGRAVERVRFKVDGAVVDFFDQNGAGGAPERLFEGPERLNEFTGSSFRVEITRTDSTGPRLGEIDAIVVPEAGPGALALSALAGLGVLARRARGKPSGMPLPS
jgi:HpiC1 cyclase